jgi:hypothetical protein
MAWLSEGTKCHSAFSHLSITSLDDLLNMSKISNDSEVVQIRTIIRFDADLLATHKSHDSIADKFTTMSDFYLLSFHQDKVMNAAKRSNSPAQLIERYSGDRGVQVLFAKLLLHIDEARKVDEPLQVHLALAKDGHWTSRLPQLSYLELFSRSTCPKRRLDRFFQHLAHRARGVQFRNSLITSSPPKLPDSLLSRLPASQMLQLFGKN